MIEQKRNEIIKQKEKISKKYHETNIIFNIIFGEIIITTILTINILFPLEPEYKTLV